MVLCYSDGNLNIPFHFFEVGSSYGKKVILPLPLPKRHQPR